MDSLVPASEALDAKGGQADQNTLDYIVFRDRRGLQQGRLLRRALNTYASSWANALSAAPSAIACIMDARTERGRWFREKRGYHTLTTPRPLCV